MRKKSIAVLMIACCLPMVMIGCGKKEAEELPPRPIKTMTIGEASSAGERTFSGVSVSTITSNLAFQVSGRIIEKNVLKGQFVEEGFVIAKIDPVDYETKVNEVKPAFIKAEAELSRYRSLYEDDSATKQELDNAQADYDASKSQLELAEQELAYTILAAEASGTIANDDFEVYEVVDVGQVLCILESGDSFDVDLGLPEYLVGRVKNGDTVSVSFESMNDQVFSAVVTSVGRRVDEATATFPVTVTLNDTNERFRSGMVADVKFTVSSDEAAGVIHVPVQAVYEDSTGSKYVWVYDSEAGVVNARKVSVGQIKTEGIEIKEGLSKGEIIVTAGVHYLEEGQKVVLVD